MNKDLKMKTAFTLAEGATHVGILHITRRVGFTLAEVLITLGIIGIVSAMTIPTLINNYKEKVRDNQFKKVYATLNQALRMTVADFDYVPKCYYPVSGNALTSDCKVFLNNFKSKLKIINDCPEKAYEKGCIPDYDGVEVVIKENHKDDPDYDEQYWENYANNLGYFKTNSLKTTTPAFVLSDGSIVIIHAYKSSSIHPLFLIDINGHGGENKWGYDMFQFRIDYDGKAFRLIGSSHYVNKGGIETILLLRKLKLYQ